MPDHFFFPGRKDTQVPECPSARLEMLDLKVGVPEGPSARPLFFSWKEGSPSARVPKCPVGDVRLESGSARRPECPTTFLFPGRYGDGRLKRGSARRPECPTLFFAEEKLAQCPNTRVPDPFLPRRNDIKLLHTSEKFISKKTKCPSARGARVPEASIPSLSSAISNFMPNSC